jgi:hypothetical protein
LDGGYRLAFTIALGSVLVGIVLGFFILKSPGPAGESPPIDGESLEPISETMIAEVL